MFVSIYTLQVCWSHEGRAEPEESTAEPEETEESEEQPQRAEL
jgi:hypothetical protein